MGITAQDRLEVINGPEDGIDFPLARSPLDLGSAPSCAVQLRLDNRIRPHQVRISAVADGYRVRRMEPGVVRAAGRRVGFIRSRIVRSGEVLQVGNTQLHLHCEPEGLASRSVGLASESDLGWFCRYSATRVFCSARTAAKYAAYLFWHHKILFTLGVVVLISVLAPGLLKLVFYTLWAKLLLAMQR
jgi:hypothetical protein